MLALIAGAAVVVVAVVAVVVALTTRGPDLPIAGECAEQGQADDAGFTRCLRQLAGATATAATCVPTDAAPVVAGFSGPTVACDLGGEQPHYRVLYTHGTGESARVLAAMASATANDRVEAEWAGNGLRGRYVSTVDGSRAVLVFVVGDRPLVGTLSAEGGAVTPDALADYFERTVMPGT